MSRTKEAGDTCNLPAKQMAGMTLDNVIHLFNNDILVMSFDALSDLLKEQRKQGYKL